MNQLSDISSIGPSIPTPTTARLELASPEVVRELGLDLGLDEARLVLTCLSHVIATGRSKTRDKVSQMMAGLIACCRVESVRDGEVIVAAHPDLPLGGGPAGATALRRLGIDHRVVERYWARARTRSTDACLPVAWVLAFVPAQFWRPVLSVVEWGPSEAALRLEDAVIELAQQPIATRNRRRPAGALLSAGTINTRITGVHQLFSVLVELRGRALASRNSGLPIALLEPWVAKPARPDPEMCGAEWARVDTSGPSLEEARGLLQRRHEEVENAPTQSRYLRLRRRLIAGLLLAHGPRVEALRQLNVDDYVPSYRFSDGEQGPALIYRPGKTRPADETHALALPQELAGWLEEWLAYTGRNIGESDSPLWPARKPKLGVVVELINASAFARTISGHAATDGSGSVPLLQRGGALPRLQPALLSAHRVSGGSPSGGGGEDRTCSRVRASEPG